jgi:hypothetical protein
MSTEELPELPKGFAYMVSDRPFRLCGHGEILRFEPGVPKPVKAGNHAEAMAHGAKMVAGIATPKAGVVPELKPDTSSADVRAQIRAAAEVILARNDSKDFGGNGHPYVRAWEAELGFKPDEQARTDIWTSVKDDALAGIDA